MSLLVSSQQQPVANWNYDAIAGHVANFDKKSEKKLSAASDVADYLKSCEAKITIEHDVLQIKIVDGEIPTNKTFSCGDQKVLLSLFHSSYNNGIKDDNDTITINLKGYHVIIPKSYFTADLATNQ